MAPAREYSGKIVQKGLQTRVRGRRAETAEGPRGKVEACDRRGCGGLGQGRGTSTAGWSGNAHAMQMHLPSAATHARISTCLLRSIWGHPAPPCFLPASSASYALQPSGRAASLPRFCNHFQPNVVLEHHCLVSALVERALYPRRHAAPPTPLNLAPTTSCRTIVPLISALARTRANVLHRPRPRPRTWSGAPEATAVAISRSGGSWKPSSAPSPDSRVASCTRWRSQTHVLLQPLPLPLTLPVPSLPLPWTEISLLMPPIFAEQAESASRASFRVMVRWVEREPG